MRKSMVKFIILILILAVLPTYVSGAEYPSVENIRIGIYYGTNAREEYIISAENGFYLGYYNERDFVMESETELCKLKISCGVEGGNFVSVSNVQTGEIIYSKDTTSIGIGIEPKSEEIEDKMLKITAKATTTYRGGFDFRRFSGGNITAVNVVYLDGYLYGVVSREMSPSWHKEALKAQAVCARNFAMGKLNRHKELGFDLCNTVCCQAYSGVNYEMDGSYAPVDETSGEVLLYEDELAQTVYSSSMGPCTEDVKNVWGSSFPYLVSVSNEYEDTENVNNGVWEKTLTKERATEIMESKGYDIGNVVDIKALEYTEAGRVLRLEVTGTKGKKVFEREKCRTVFAEATLSQMYTISGGGKTTYPIIYVLGADGKKAISLENLHIIGEGTISYFNATDGNKTMVYKGTTAGDSFVFSGQGWGHGVGMSQYGAKGMAEAGFDYEEILTHYYKGTHLER